MIVDSSGHILMSNNRPFTDDSDIQPFLYRSSGVASATKDRSFSVRAIREF
jgi:hypothetical protein